MCWWTFRIEEMGSRHIHIYIYIYIYIYTYIYIYIIYTYVRTYIHIDIDIYSRANPRASRDSHRVSNLCRFLICADALTNLLRPSKKTKRNYLIVRPPTRIPAGRVSVTEPQPLTLNPIPKFIRDSPQTRGWHPTAAGPSRTLASVKLLTAVKTPTATLHHLKPQTLRMTPPRPYPTVIGGNRTVT